MSNVVIHRRIKEYTKDEIEEKRGNSEKENDFNFFTFIPKSFNFKTDEQDAIIDDIILKMIKDRNYKKISYSKEYKSLPSNIDLYCSYIKNVKTKRISSCSEFENNLKSFRGRSDSGVLVYTLLMSDKPNGRPLTCKHDCFYCPNQPNMARSYIADEPAVKRGNQFNWNVQSQIINRHKSYITTGQISAFEPSCVKGEFIIEGGTYSAYPKSYRKEFMTQLYYSCNVIYSVEKRQILSLEEEMKINETILGIRVVGLSIETRPDDIDEKLLRELREFGVTKVQIGVQHTNDDILAISNRKCYDSHTRYAMKQLLANGFKIQIHLMPDLPGSNPEMDMKMFQEIFSDTGYGFDHVKIYPVMIVNYTKIKEWYDNRHNPEYQDRRYHPYGDNTQVMLDVLIKATKILIENQRYDIRIERIVRDIPSHDIEGGTSNLNLGDILTKTCKTQNINCICIRCREIKDNILDNDSKLLIRKREMCGNSEYFISFENDNYISGFLRLSIRKNDEFTYFRELENTPIIRELHVYGTSISVGSRNNGNAQNRGIGKMLVTEAKKICKELGYNRIAVISGNGVKEYYKNKHGFMDEGLYMISSL